MINYISLRADFLFSGLLNEMINLICVMISGGWTARNPILERKHDVD